MNNKHKGVSLIECLVSLVILAVLSGVSMFSSSEGLSSSRVARVIESMRIIKTAVLVWVNGNPDHIYNDGTVNADMKKVNAVSGKSIQDALKNPNNRDLIRKYIGNGQNLSFNMESGGYYCNEDEYAIVSDSDGDSWFVCYRFPNITSTMTKRIREKTESRAHTEGLYKGVDGKTFYTATTGEKTQDAVYMKIIEF